MDAIAERPAAPPPAPVRGAATRDALLDAAEKLVSAHGFTTPSHRMIAGEASTHVALVNYHFGSKEQLFEAALERRAHRLTGLWKEALAGVRAMPGYAIGDVLRAWWGPFRELDIAREEPWGNYLCTFARLGSAAEGETWYRRYFGAADRDFLDAFAHAMPGASADDVEAAFRYARTLLAEILLYRCGKMGGSCRPRGYRDDDADRVLRFIEAGMRGVAEGVSARP